MRAELKRIIPKFKAGSAAFEALVVATTAATTALVTYKIASKRIEAEFAARIDEEIEATRKFYSALNEKPDLDSMVLEVPEEDQEPLVEPAPEVIKDPRPPVGHPGGRGLLVDYNKLAKNYVENALEEAEEESTDDPTDLPEVNNIFDGESTTTLPPEVVDVRDPDKPYVITHEEYVESETGADTLTYYLDDATLCDSDEDAIDDIEGMVGKESLAMFGMGSGDPRIVYVRNERIGQDFEIILVHGSYGETVHGIAPVVGRRSSQEE